MPVCAPRLPGRPFRRVSPPLPALWTGHESVRLHLCGWCVPGSACVLARVCGRGVVCTRQWWQRRDRAQCSRVPCVCMSVWRGGCAERWVFPQSVSSPQLKAGRVLLSWSKVSLSDQGFWACQPDPNPNPSARPTPPAPHPRHLRPGPLAPLPHSKPRAAPPKVIPSVGLGAGPVSGGRLHAHT